MNYGPLIFLAAFLGLAASWCGFVLAPQIQLGRQQQVKSTAISGDLYPQPRPGLAQQGQDVYRENGCFYCHTRQVTQTGLLADVVLTEVGEDPMAAAQGLLQANVGVTNASGPGLAAGLPKPVLQNVRMDVARAAVTALKAAGATANIDIVPTGPDIARSWGKRRSVAPDFLFDQPVMLGSLRAGPDLANVGVRLPDANWHLLHLYNPRITVEDSPMPAYPFLFETRPIGHQPAPDALQFPEQFAPPAGYEVVPRPEARALVAYLLSQQANVPVFPAPMSLPPAPPAEAETNAPAQ